jgi:ParB family chromosome partitioning protein
MEYTTEQLTDILKFDHALTPDEVKKLYKIMEKGSPKIKQELQDGVLSIEEAYKKVTVHVSNNSGKYEWYTPHKFIEAARNVMGSIDLDPASSETANKIVRATKYYTKEDNGLIQPWEGNIWLNPPYNNSLVVDFTEKLLNELTNINEACVLVNNATETRWFQKILNASDAVCFVKGRIKFLDENGNATGSSLQGQAILFFGYKNLDLFYSNFQEFGTCMTIIKDF